LIDDASAINLVEVDDNVEGGGDGTVDGAVGEMDAGLQNTE
jgi:hypothetical protein